MEQYLYIHGVLGLGGHSHTGQYRALRDGISAELIARGGSALPALGDGVLVEWGYDHPLAGDTALLDRAQKVIAARVAAATPSDRTSFSSLLLAPAVEPVRGLIQHTWADILYYISEKGKAQVRRVVWGRLLEKANTNAPLDLTVIGHSAGSMIAVDFLFWLFSDARDNPDALKAMGLDPAVVAAARRNWRLRRLVTFGSPIAPLLIRSVDVTRMLADDEVLDARDLGLGQPAHSGEEPVWLNVWDRHDVLSWPVEPFFTGGLVRDLYPDHSDSLLGSHEAYWSARKVHKMLASSWDVQP